MSTIEIQGKHYISIENDENVCTARSGPWRGTVCALDNDGKRCKSVPSSGCRHKIFIEATPENLTRYVLVQLEESG